MNLDVTPEELKVLVSACHTMRDQVDGLYVAVSRGRSAGVMEQLAEQRKTLESVLTKVEVARRQSQESTE